MKRVCRGCRALMDSTYNEFRCDLGYAIEIKEKRNELYRIKTYYAVPKEECQFVYQMEKYHPEGNVLNHSLQLLYYAFKETDDIDLIFAAMLHDIGKIENSRGHENLAIEWLESYTSVKTLWLIEHHIRIWELMLGGMRRLGKVQYLIDHPWLPELILLARFDKLGRNPHKQMKYNPQDIIERLNKKVNSHFDKKVKDFS